MYHYDKQWSMVSKDRILWVDFVLLKYYHCVIQCDESTKDLQPLSVRRYPGVLLD